MFSGTKADIFTDELNALLRTFSQTIDIAASNRGRDKALQEQKTFVELAGEYGVHPTQTVKWKKELQERAKEIFGKDAFRNAKEAEMKEAELYRQIGRLKVEVDWLKKIR